MFNGSVTVIDSSADPVTAPASKAVMRQVADPARKRNFSAAKPASFAADTLALWFSIAAGFWISGEIPHGFIFVAAGSILLLNAFAGLYRSRIEFSLLDDLPILAGRAVVSFGMSGVALAAIKAPYGLLHVVSVGGVYLLSVLVMRGLVYALVRRARSTSFASRRTLVVGAGQIGGRLVESMINHPELGLRPVGFADDQALLPNRQRLVPLLTKDLSAVSQVIVDHHIDVVVIAFSNARGSDMVDTIRSCQLASCEILVVPRLFEVHQQRSDMDRIWGIPVIRLNPHHRDRLALAAKRLFDLVVSALALLVLSPLLAVIALAVSAERQGPLLFRQERIGLDGKIFQLIKFRSLSMVDPLESDTRWSIDYGSRITALGAFLRKTSLDELPQLWNVLVGDMSLVGPRPERPHFVENFTKIYQRYSHRHRLPAGLTGWAQIHGLRGNTSITDRARFDNYYIENWSLWLDVKILIRTVVALIRFPGR